MGQLAKREQCQRNTDHKVSKAPTLAHGELQLAKPDNNSKNSALMGRLSRNPEDICVCHL